ncbi:metal ABC transporter substrate-binding protein [Glutamicibacter sp. MNS18]|uniref:metal ABC transporter substrate-binding protein n=1 Tax=Glutamicibacter sp. MNS18 TaxID=2989817 RepID=UPI002236ADFA|nr:metal ABC transporter substrate-binding protein [Glutamicibacter sp. MNS18]MCW4465790.1 metal ABC transporter substrate-binding protein [Glutamicibacter sp. MNS18]
MYQKIGRKLVGMAAVLGLLAVTGCTADAANPEAGQPVAVYATTGYLADAVANIAPEAQVTTMVGPGGDPHTYQPSTRDIEKMRDADVVLWNGLYLEAQMIDQLQSLGERQLAVGELVPEHLLLSWPETDHEGNALHDPHIWNSPEAWKLVVQHVADKLGQANPAAAQQYQENSAQYLERIEQAAQNAADLLSDVPQPRILVTGHDAFNYFGQTFGFEVHATDFVSTEAALSPVQLSELADLIVQNRVPVIFQDNQANPQAVTSLREAVDARGWDVRVSTEELYADSLGAEPGVDTYLGVFEHNAQVVAESFEVGQQ